jgi:hypothetical protein
VVGLFVFVNGVSFGICTSNPNEVPAVFTLHKVQYSKGVITFCKNPPKAIDAWIKLINRKPVIVCEAL